MISLKFIPDYPTQAYKITIENLLTHTSGIKSYTNVPEFKKYIKDDFKPEEVIDKFKNLPMEFAPGTKWNYNNSGFFLLGYIIEKAIRDKIPGLYRAKSFQAGRYDKLSLRKRQENNQKQGLSLPD